MNSTLKKLNQDGNPKQPQATIKIITRYEVSA